MPRLHVVLWCRVARLSRTYLPPFLSHRPSSWNIFFCCCLQLPVVHTVVLGTPNNYDVIWEAGHGRPPIGYITPKGRHQSSGVFDHSSHNGTGIPDFFRPFTLWAVLKLLCKLMSQIDGSFSTVLEMQPSLLQDIVKEKHHSNRPFLLLLLSFLPLTVPDYQMVKSCFVLFFVSSPFTSTAHFLLWG